MPLYSIVQFELEKIPTQKTLLNNAVHGLIHHVLTRATSTHNETLSAATKLHDSQRQSITIRAFQYQGSQLKIQLTTLSSYLEEAVREAFAVSNVFGSENTLLQGRINAVQHQAFTLEKLCDIIRCQPAAKRLRIDFKSPTAFTHKRGTWASPHPGLLFKSLLARWNDFGGVPLGFNEACIVRAEPKITTFTTKIGASPMPAFEGQLNLELVGDSSECWDITTLLAFASLANTGRRVAYGCGLVEATAFLNRNLELKLNPDLLAE